MKFKAIYTQSLYYNLIDQGHKELSAHKYECKYIISNMHGFRVISNKDWYDQCTYIELKETVAKSSECNMLHNKYSLVPAPTVINGLVLRNDFAYCSSANNRY